MQLASQLSKLSAPVATLNMSVCACVHACACVFSSFKLCLKLFLCCIRQSFFLCGSRINNTNNKNKSQQSNNMQKNGNSNKACLEAVFKSSCHFNWYCCAIVGAVVLDFYTQIPTHTHTQTHIHICTANSNIVTLRRETEKLKKSGRWSLWSEVCVFLIADLFIIKCLRLSFLPFFLFACNKIKFKINFASFDHLWVGATPTLPCLS